MHGPCSQAPKIQLGGRSATWKTVAGPRLSHHGGYARAGPPVGDRHPSLEETGSSAWTARGRKVMLYIPFVFPFYLHVARTPSVSEGGEWLMETWSCRDGVTQRHRRGLGRSTGLLSSLAKLLYSCTHSPAAQPGVWVSDAASCIPASHMPGSPGSESGLHPAPFQLQIHFSFPFHSATVISLDTRRTPHLETKGWDARSSLPSNTFDLCDLSAHVF